MTYSITKDGETESPKTATADVEETISAVGKYTVKASATDGTNTKEATAITFTVEEQPTAASIAEFISKGTAVGADTEIEFTAPLYVTYQNGSRTFVRDDAGDALLIYGAKNTYTNGNVIPAGAKGTYTLYQNSTPEMENPVLAEATETKDVAPIEKAVNAVATTDVNQYIVIKGVKVDATSKTFTDNAGNSIAFYDTFKLNNAPTDATKLYDVVGIVTIYNNAAQIAPISFTESQVAETKCANPVFSLEEGTYAEAQTLTITSTEGSTIVYTINNGEKIEAASPATVELPVVDGQAETYVIEAFATKEGLDDSETVAKTYVIDNAPKTDNTLEVVIADIAAANGWENQTVAYSFEKDGFTFSVDENGSNEPVYNTKSQTWRFYTGATMTITAPENFYISSVEFTTGSDWSIECSEGSFTDDTNTTWIAANATTSSVGFKATKKSFIKGIKVTYTSKGSGVAEIGSEDATISTTANGVVVSTDKAAAVSIYNAAGQATYSATVAEGETTINLPAGFYIVRAGNAVAKVIVK